MHPADYLTIALYTVFVLAISVAASRRIRDHKDMFTTNRQSPWWVAGLSGFMTMFSAGTFVVWGGIAYRLGLVAIMINSCYGIAAMLVGYFVAGRWNSLGVTTPAEYVQLRFGTTGLHLFTWTMLMKRILGVSVSLYALAVLLSALIPLGEANAFRDPHTGTLSLSWAIIAFGSVVVLYTMIGGLWAVLMTDVLQFIVLLLVVLLIAALMLTKSPNIATQSANLPDDFFSPVAGGYGWIFLFGWVTIHFFMVGAEWAFVQRFLAVRTPRDASKSCYLFGALYLVSPLLWLMPPMLYRGMNSGANPEQAYILAAQSVLPPGVLGLLIAAMFSATASMVSSQLNVFAGVLTNDFYRAFLNRNASNQRLVVVGRFFTALLGALLVVVALLVPYLGGAERLIIAINSLMVVPLLSPALWGLFSRKIGIRQMVVVAMTSFILGATLKFGVLENPLLESFERLEPTLAFLKGQTKNLEVLVGVILPVVLLCIFELRPGATDAGWHAVLKHERETSPCPAGATASDNFARNVVAVGMLTCGVATLGLAYLNQASLPRTALAGIAALLLVTAVATKVWRQRG